MAAGYKSENKTLHLWNMFTPTLVLLVNTTLVVYTNMCTYECTGFLRLTIISLYYILDIFYIPNTK